jgi:hypothetical protein
MLTDTIKLNGYTFTPGAQGEVVKRWPNGAEEKYRRTNDPSEIEYASTRRDSTWRTCQVYSSYDQDIVKALDHFWPQNAPKVEPFGEGEWLPAGEGCVRKTATRTTHARYRRAPGGLEGQDRRTKEWRPITSGDSFRRDCMAALDHFWPSSKVEGLFDDGTGDKWARVNTNVVRSVAGTAQGWEFRRIDDDVSITVPPSMMVCQVNPNDVGWRGRVVRHFWPDLFEKKEQKPMTEPQESPIAWTFKTAPEDIDMPRILREAHEAGAREVTVERDGQTTTYLHHDKRATVASWWLYTQSAVRNQCFADFACASSVPGWEIVGHPCLAEARAWQAVQETARKAKEARRVVVKVNGVR